jgi:hypothetical protein
VGDQAFQLGLVVLRDDRARCSSLRLVRHGHETTQGRSGRSPYWRDRAYGGQIRTPRTTEMCRRSLGDGTDAKARGCLPCIRAVGTRSTR